MTAMIKSKRSKLLASLFAVVLLTIIVLQNTEEVATRILFFEFALPRAVLLLLAAAIGFLFAAVLFVGRARVTNASRAVY